MTGIEVGTAVKIATTAHKVGKYFPRLFEGQKLEEDFRGLMDEIVVELCERLDKVEAELRNIGASPVVLDAIQLRQMTIDFAESIGQAGDEFQRESLLNVYAGFINPNGGSYLERMHWAKVISELSSGQIYAFKLLNKYYRIASLNDDYASWGHMGQPEKKDFFSLGLSTSEKLLLGDVIAADKHWYFEQEQFSFLDETNKTNILGSATVLNQRGKILLNKMTKTLS